MNSHIHKFPYHSVLRERERIAGGLEVGSDEAAAAIARVRAKLGAVRYIDKNATHRLAPDPTHIDARTTPMGEPRRPKGDQP